MNTPHSELSNPALSPSWRAMTNHTMTTTASKTSKHLEPAPYLGEHTIPPGSSENSTISFASNRKDTHEANSHVVLRRQGDHNAETFASLRRSYQSTGKTRRAKNDEDVEDTHKKEQLKSRTSTQPSADIDRWKNFRDGFVDEDMPTSTVGAEMAPGQIPGSMSDPSGADLEFGCSGSSNQILDEARQESIINKSGVPDFQKGEKSNCVQRHHRRVLIFSSVLLSLGLVGVIMGVLMKPLNHQGTDPMGLPNNGICNTSLPEDCWKGCLQAIHGTIPTEIGLLDHLECLVIENSNLKPGPIPTTISQLTRLTRLSLHNTSLTGRIPSEVSRLVKLTSLTLSDNKLTGTIPLNITNLSELHSLDLSHNKLSGTIPSEISILVNLTSLNFSYNELNGTIPSETSNLVNLTVLSLSDNKLSGTIPSEISNLVNLTSLDLSHNILSGTIPSEISILVKLTSLSLSDNKLSGTIPSETANLVNLTVLSLSDNDLTGTIPWNITNLSELHSLDLSHNKLSGTIPSEISILVNLTSLSLSDNKLTGTIPSETSNLVNLTVLSLSDNKLSGTIPSEISNLVNLTSLTLSYNELNGTLPLNITNLSELNSLELSHNNIMGSIPTFEDMTKLQSVTLEDNNFTEILFQGNSCINLPIITLDCAIDGTENCSCCFDNVKQSCSETVGNSRRILRKKPSDGK